MSPFSGVSAPESPPRDCCLHSVAAASARRSSLRNCCLTPQAATAKSRPLRTRRSRAMTFREMAGPSAKGQPIDVRWRAAAARGGSHDHGIHHLHIPVREAEVRLSRGLAAACRAVCVLTRYPALLPNGRPSLRLGHVTEACLLLSSSPSVRLVADHENALASRQLRLVRRELCTAGLSSQRRGSTCVGSVVAGRDESGFVGEHDGMDAVAEGEFGEYVRHVGFDGRFAHDELGGDFGVREAACDQREDLELA